MKRGKHGCYIHTDMRGSQWDRMRPVEASDHHAPLNPPRTPGQVGPPTVLLEAECRRCGATVKRTKVGNVLTEVWTLR